MAIKSKEVTSSLDTTTMYYYQGDLVATWPSTITSYIQRATADFDHRSKPVPLTDTILTRYTRRVRDDYMGWKIGTNNTWYGPRHLYNNDPGGNKNYSFSKESFDERDRHILMAQTRIGSGDFDLALFLAEIRENVSQVTSRAAWLLQIVNLIRKGRYDEVWKTFSYSPSRTQRQLAYQHRHSTPYQRLANTWLEFEFGWRPLLSDIYSIIELIDKGLSSEKGKQLKASSGIIKPYTIRGDEPYSSINPQSKAVYYATIENPFLYNLNQLGLTNPVSVFWQTLPFSFVVDWILPIGTYLQGVTAHLGLKDVRGYAISELLQFSVNGGNGTYQVAQTVYRIPLEADHDPGLVTPVLPVDLRKLGNILALLVQRFSGKL